MLSFETRCKTKTLRLIIFGLLVHLSIFLGALDVYFFSPVEHGLRSFKANVTLADRVVIFVADGLRFEAIRDIYSDERTPFLNEIRREYGSWGISFAQVPTESRPGHVALFGGMYEDPSAVLSGWKHNFINVDNVFNQSVESWLWGSPDIVPMFNRDNVSKINTFYYDPSFEDFSGRKSTIELDKWVIEKVTNYFKDISVEYCHIHCKSLLGSGKIFFLHLLGMDTVGHVFKPNSREYFSNLKYVDYAIKEISYMFEKFFQDNRTAYIFTSDHGMTDWGSHGSGSDHEIESPFIAWGSGINKKGHKYNIYQADVAPLISALLGINIPTNSVGLTPCIYLNTSDKEEVHILFSNVKQLGERFNRRHERMQKATMYGLFKPFDKLNKQLFDEIIDQIEKTIRTKLYKIAKNDVIKLIELVREGDKYINHYYKYPLLFTLSLGLLFWMIYLALNIIPWQEQQELEISVSKSCIFRCFVNYGLIIIALVIALQCKYSK